MNTWMTIKVVGGKGTKKVTKDVEQFFKDFEAQISTTDKNSEVYILNEKSCDLSLTKSKKMIAMSYSILFIDALHS